MRALGGNKVRRRCIGDMRVWARYVGDELIFDHAVHGQRSLQTHFDVRNNTGQGFHDPTAGTWHDLKGGAVAALANASWGQDGGVVFNGTTSKVSYTGFPLTGGTNEYTILNVHKIAALTGQHPRIWAESPYPSLYLHSNNQYGYGFFGQGRDAVFPARFTPPVGTLIQAALRFSGTTVDLFVNGRYIDSLTGVTGTIGNPNPIFLGARAANDRTLNGAIYEHLVYNRALTDEEMVEAFAVSRVLFGIGG